MSAFALGGHEEAAEKAFEMQVGQWCAERALENARSGRVETDDEIFAHVAGTAAFRELVQAVEPGQEGRTPEEHDKLHATALRAAQGSSAANEHEEEGGGEAVSLPLDIIYMTQSVDLQIDGKTRVAGGSLTVLKDRIELVKTNGSDRDLYAFTFPQILLHAVCREGVERPSVYMQVEDIEEDGDGDPESASEVYLIPSQASDVDDIFGALCTGAELNPDVGGDDDEAVNSEGMWFSDAQGMVGEDATSMDEATIMERLAAFDKLLVPSPAVVDGQFDDAE